MAVVLAFFADSLAYGLAVPILPALAVSLGASQTMVGVLVGAYSLVLLAATAFFGHLADRVPRRSLLIAGMLGLALAGALYASAMGMPALFLARALQGAAAAATWTVGLALVAEVFPPERRGRALGLTLTADAAGFLVGPLLGGYLAQQVEPTLPFLVIVPAALAVALYQALVLTSPPRQVSAPVPAIRLLLDPSVVALAAIAALSAGVFGVIEPTMPLDLQSRLGASPAEIGLLFSVSTVAYAVATPLAGSLGDRLGHRRVTIAGLAAAGLLLPALVLPASLAIEAVVFALLGAVGGLTIAPILPELAAAVDRLGGGAYGVAYASFNAASAVGALVGAVVGASLADRFGLAPALLAIGLATVLFAGLLWPAFVRDRGGA